MASTQIELITLVKKVGSKISFSSTAFIKQSDKSDNNVLVQIKCGKLFQ